MQSLEEIISLTSPDTDDDADDYEDLNARQISKKKEKKRLTNGEPDDPEEPEIPDDLPFCPDPDNPGCNCEECKWYDEHYPEEEAMVQREKSPEAQELIRLVGETMEIDTNPDGPDMREQWIILVEREAGKTFLQQWHEADLTPGSKQRWRAMADLLTDAMKIERGLDLSSNTVIDYLKLGLWLRYPSSKHRLLPRNFSQALILASLPFGWSSITQAVRPRLTPEKLALLDELTDNNKKAQGEPYARSIQPDEVKADEFFKEAALELKANNRETPDAWDLKLRPVVAAWFRAGMLCPAYDHQAYGHMALAREPGKQKPEIFIDYHGMEMNDSPSPEHRKIDLLAHANAFATTHKSSRSSLLRLWSHSHFWPLLLAGANREDMAFADSIGRIWHSRFIPKDMPYSDISMHNMVQERVKQFKKQFTGKVVFKRDMALVIAENEEDLRWNMAGVIFALQNRPWRFEVDLWKSFVNVDQDFLKGLDEKWLV